MCDQNNVPTEAQLAWARELGISPDLPKDEICRQLREKACRLKLDNVYDYCGNATTPQSVLIKCGRSQAQCMDIKDLASRISSDADPLTKRFSVNDRAFIRMLSIKRDAHSARNLTCPERAGNKLLCEFDNRCVSVARTDKESWCVPTEGKCEDVRIIVDLVLMILYVHDRTGYSRRNDARYITPEDREAIVERVQALSDTERCSIYKNYMGEPVNAIDVMYTASKIFLPANLFLNKDLFMSNLPMESEQAILLSVAFNFVLCAVSRKKQWSAYFFYFPNSLAVLVDHIMAKYKSTSYIFFGVIFNCSLNPKTLKYLNLNNEVSTSDETIDRFNSLLPLKVEDDIQAIKKRPDTFYARLRRSYLPVTAKDIDVAALNAKVDMLTKVLHEKLALILK
jgi:hypothetical protein